MNAPSKPRVLVVDDESALVTALCSTLSREGYESTGAVQPARAIELLRRQPFDILLTDLQMPEVNGIDLLRTALQIDPWMVGVLMTGHGTVDRAVEAMKAGAFDFVIKPFKLSVLLSTLSRAIGVRQLRLDNDKLQQRLQARTAELEAANKELEAFTYSVSHDLRGPLRAISGFNELIQEEIAELKSDALRDHSKRVASNVDRMNRIIDDLLRLARTARAEVRREPLDLGQMAQDIASKIESENGQRHVQWQITPELKVCADPGLMRIALENLLSNAWKYTSKIPQARIDIGTEPGKNDERVYFVRDNGAGFDMAHVKRLFVPFERLHADAEFAGSGVGLATVARIIHKHGGQIWGEGEPGHGATFRFTLPNGQEGG